MIDKDTDKPRVAEYRFKLPKDPETQEQIYCLGDYFQAEKHDGESPGNGYLKPMFQPVCLESNYEGEDYAHYNFTLKYQIPRIGGERESCRVRSTRSPMKQKDKIAAMKLLSDKGIVG